MLADIYGLLRMNLNNSGDPPTPRPRFHLAPPEVQMFIKFCLLVCNYHYNLTGL